MFSFNKRIDTECLTIHTFQDKYKVSLANNIGELTKSPSHSSRTLDILQIYDKPRVLSLSQLGSFYTCP